jgi:hypothetical protein
MPLITVNAGARIDLEFYKGYPVINYDFQVLQDNCSNYDFSNSTAVYFRLLAKRNGTELALIQMSFSNPKTNYIYLNDSGSSPSVITQRFNRTCWYEVYSVEGQNKLLFEGIAQL